MLKFIRRDLLILFSSWKAYIPWFLILPILLLIFGVEKINEIMISSIFIIGFFLSTIPFSYDIRIKPYILMQSLPVTRKELVVSKYLSTLIFYIVGSVYTVSILWIIKYFEILNMDNLNFYFLKEAFLLLILTLSLSFPSYLIFKPKLGAFLNALSYMISIEIFLISPERTFGSLALLNKYGLVIVFIYLISLGISIWFYEIKDLV